MNKIFFIFLGIFFLFFINAQAEDYYKLTYIIPEETDFAEAIRTFVKDDAIINAKSPMVIKTIKKNPHIKDWKNLIAGQELDLYIDARFIDFQKYLNYEKRIIAEINKNKLGVSYKTSAYNHGLKSSVYYMISSGTFTQKNPQFAKAEFNQTTPLTFGLSLAYYPKRSLYSTSLNFSYSAFNSASTNLNNESVKNDPDVGIALYEEYRTARLGTIFAGFDYESFSTFDLETINNLQQINFNKNKVTYLTVGVAKSFKIFDKLMLSKASFSQSLFSSQSSTLANTTDEYKGSKILLYLDYKFTENFFFHTQFKYHWMKGIDQITVSRIGVGFGYVLF